MAPLFIFLLLAIPVAFIFILPWQKNAKKKPHYPPGPPGLPLIGNMHQFDAQKSHLWLHELFKKYGPLMSLRLGSKPVIVISSARIAKEAFTTHDIAFSGRPQFTGQRIISYGGMDIAFSPYSDYWREMRKLAIINIFSNKQVNSFGPIRRDEVTQLMNEISKKSKVNEVVNLKDLLLSLSSSLICRVAFGKSNKESSSGDKTFDSIIEQVGIAITRLYIGDYIPSLGWIDRLTGLVSRLERCFKDSDTFYQEMIEEHLSPNKPKSMEGDMVDLLIQLKKEQPPSVNFTWNNVKAILADVFIAGSDTSAAVTNWAMMALIRTPSAMIKVQEEIRGIIGDKGFVEEDDIPKLPYLKAVIKETMRLYPAVPLLVPRETTQSCTIDGYTIPAKALVFINFWTIGRDPTYWENPEEFLPDRFMNSKMDYKGRDFDYIPFGSGRRICPGIALGTATVEILLANLLYTFNWKVPDGMTPEDIDTDSGPGITTHKKNALCLMAEIYK